MRRTIASGPETIADPFHSGDGGASDDVDSLLRVASSPRVHYYLLDLFERIEGDPYLDDDRRRLNEAVNGDGNYWDMCCVLAAFVATRRPTRYLEIGVRRGRSACVVAGFAPRTDLYLFDMWATDYAGVANPGPDFVLGQLARAGHRGQVHFGTGRSSETIPAFFANKSNPRHFDLITVDGDHRDDGARADLDNVVDHLVPGGMIVIDDIAHPQFPTLHGVWKAFLGRNPSLVARENVVDATGTGVALRRSDDADNDGGR